jgi:hypothetical protein
MIMKFYQECILKEEITKFKRSYQKCFHSDSNIKVNIIIMVSIAIKKIFRQL